MDFHGVDVLYIVPLTILFLMTIAIYIDKVNIFHGLFAVGLALGISYFWSPYQEIVIDSIAGVLWYGYTPGLLFYASIIHIAAMFYAGLMAYYNWHISEGKGWWW